MLKARRSNERCRPWRVTVQDTNTPTALDSSLIRYSLLRDKRSTLHGHDSASAESATAAWRNNGIRTFTPTPHSTISPRLKFQQKSDQDYPVCTKWKRRRTAMAVLGTSCTAK
ncbi:hypothetical protein ANO11243_066880 [Dothideomycetidae sp. 11243]|nr:hypothetical protein ANO11243_066880 [fungal sp. No.11243]